MVHRRKSLHPFLVHERHSFDQYNTLYQWRAMVAVRKKYKKPCVVSSNKQSKICPIWHSLFAKIGFFAIYPYKSAESTMINVARFHILCGLVLPFCQLRRGNLICFAVSVMAAESFICEGRTPSGGGSKKLTVSPVESAGTPEN